MIKTKTKNYNSRKLNRWPGFNYSCPGYYFVTICSKNMEKMFGDIKNYKIVLNEVGEIVKKQWLWLSDNFEYINLDAWVIMPNHLHGVIEIKENDKSAVVGTGLDCKIFEENHNVVGNVLERSLQNQNDQKILPLYRIIGAFKTTSSKLIHQRQNNLYFKWQRSFHDRVIRNEQELSRIRIYIANNPINWQTNSTSK